MRKKQESILKNAQKRCLTKEQISILSREDIPVRKLDDLLFLFSRFPDAPADEALNLVWEKAYNAWHINLVGGYRNNDGKYTFISFKELMSLLSLVCMREWIFYPIKELYEVYDGKEKLTYFEFAKLVLDLIGKGHIPEGLLKFACPKILRHNESVSFKASLDFISYIVLFEKALVELFEKVFYEDAVRYWSVRAREYWDITRHDYNMNKFLRYNCYMDEYLISKFGQFADLEDCYRRGIAPEEAVKMATDNKNRELVDDFLSLRKKTVYLYSSKEQKDSVAMITKLHLEEVVVKGVESFSVECDHRSHTETADYPTTLTFRHGWSVLIKNGRKAPWDIDSVVLHVSYGGEVSITHKKNGKKTRRPAMIREILSLSEEYGFSKLTDFCVKRGVLNRGLLKDLQADFSLSKKENLLFPPILWNDCLHKHNRRELAESVYKNAEGINWNRLGLCAGYTLMHTRNFVDDASAKVLFNEVSNGNIRGTKDDFARGRKFPRKVAESTVFDYLTRKVKGDPREVIQEVHDYVQNVSYAGIKLNMKLTSLKKVVDKNTQVVLAAQNKSTPEIIVPEKSVFLPLREALPENFEWITSRERIIAEGTLMRHCVASYAGYVNNDTSAIYHLNYGGVSYTVEFKVIKKAYVVNQIQSKCDRGAPNEVWDYVSSLVAGLDVPKRDKKKGKKKTA